MALNIYNTCLQLWIRINNIKKRLKYIYFITYKGNLTILKWEYYYLFDSDYTIPIKLT